MGFFKDICNRCLIEELEEEIGQNVALFTVQGFALYGKLEFVTDNRIGHLVPGANSFGSVRVRTPFGSTVVNESFVNVDLCTVVAKSTGLISPPF